MYIIIEQYNYMTIMHIPINDAVMIILRICRPQWLAACEMESECMNRER